MNVFIHKIPISFKVHGKTGKKKKKKKKRGP